MPLSFPQNQVSPTMQTFLSGSGTYTTPAGCKWIEVKMVGGGGGVIAISTSLSATYSYAVGVGGTAGTAGTSGAAGGLGGSGSIYVTEHYGYG